MIKVNKRNYYIHTIDYNCSGNGFKGTHKILSSIRDPKKVKEIALVQLDRAETARFKPLLPKENNRITNGWLLAIDKPVFNIY